MNPKHGLLTCNTNIVLTIRCYNPGEIASEQPFVGWRRGGCVQAGVSTFNNLGTQLFAAGHLKCGSRLERVVVNCTHLNILTVNNNNDFQHTTVSRSISLGYHIYSF